LSSKSFIGVQENNNKMNFDSLKLLLLKLKNNQCIDEIFYKRLQSDTYRTPIIYFLPKIHKLDYETNLKFRPIVSTFNSYCSNLAFEFSKILSNEVNHVKKGTFNFLENLRKIRLNYGYKLCSLDIENLISSIPLDNVIAMAADILFNYFKTKISKADLIKLLNYCTKYMTFKFNGKLYRQNDGITMGSPLAPILAEIYLNDFENKYIKSNRLFEYLFYYRFVDDIFLILLSDSNLNKILTDINSVDNHLKFTMEIENNLSLNFLDVLIMHNSNTLSTRWFRKASNTLTFQHWNSCSPAKYKIQLIYTMIRRIYNIASNNDYFKLDIELLKTSFRYSGYPENIINIHFNKAISNISVTKPLNSSKSATGATTLFYFGI
jgi:hypothetical protein